MKMLFVGVFDKLGRSTNVSQILALKKIGCEVYGYNFKQKELQIGSAERDKHLVEYVKQNNFDLVLYSKSTGISFDCFKKINLITTTCLWWMDPLSTLGQHPEILEKSSEVDFVVTGVKNTIPIFYEKNKNTFFAIEGFDENVDQPHDLKKQYDVTFIGSLHSQRQKLMNQIVHPVNHVTNAYSRKHAEVVSKSKICLNFSTAGGASDRVFKTLAAGGFLLTSDWQGRDELFSDGEHLIIYDDIQDLNDKISYYLNNKQLRDKISMQGNKKVQEYGRIGWAQEILNFYEGIK